jgi:hypothetical protein
MARFELKPSLFWRRCADLVRLDEKRWDAERLKALAGAIPALQHSV